MQQCHVDMPGYHIRLLASLSAAFCNAHIASLARCVRGQCPAPPPFSTDSQRQQCVQRQYQ